MHLQPALTGMKCGCLTVSFPSCLSDGDSSMQRITQAARLLTVSRLQIKQTEARCDENQMMCSGDTLGKKEGRKQMWIVRVCALFYLPYWSFSYCGVWARLSCMCLHMKQQLDLICPWKTCRERSSRFRFRMIPFHVWHQLINILFGLVKDDVAEDSSLSRQTRLFFFNTTETFSRYGFRQVQGSLTAQLLCCEREKTCWRTSSELEQLVFRWVKLPKSISCSLAHRGKSNTVEYCYTETGSLKKDINELWLRYKLCIYVYVTQILKWEWTRESHIILK